MELLFFVLVAIGLNGFADWILCRIEAFVGRPLEQRSLVFFAILLLSALLSFWIIRRLLPA